MPGIFDIAPYQPAPVVSAVIDQQFVIEPLTGSREISHYLERFPEEFYLKTPDTILYKYMQVLLGDQGANWIRKNALEARLILEELGIDLFDLDKFYGDPFGFGRIIEESFDEDPHGLITRDQWEQIKAKNSRYRNRAIDFFNGARAGSTPLGMQLAAKSGLGHDVGIIEHYRWLYDQHSDMPLGLRRYGSTTSTEEFVVVPRREHSRSEVQRIAISNDPVPDQGTFVLGYNGEPAKQFVYDDGTGPRTIGPLPFDATADMVRLSLETINQIGPGNVLVSGGPGPYTPWDVTFTGELSDTDVPELSVSSALSSSITPSAPIGISVSTQQNGQQSYDEVVNIPPKDAFTLQDALDRVRPQTSIPTFQPDRGLREVKNWQTAYASSEYREVVRYVTGNPHIKWPKKTPTKAGQDSLSWVQAGEENAAPRVYNDLQHHYQGFHTVQAIKASSTQIDPPPASRPAGMDSSFKPEHALANPAEPTFVTATVEIPGMGLVSFLNGIYPTSYKTLPGVPPPTKPINNFWRSKANPGPEFLELTFFLPQAFNYISFEMNRIPCVVSVEYDVTSDVTQVPTYLPVRPIEPYSNVVTSSTTSTSRTPVSLLFANGKGELIFTTRLRVTLTRQGTYQGPIEVANLRVGRNVS
jgi:hypothetical protein